MPLYTGLPESFIEDDPENEEGDLLPFNISDDPAHGGLPESFIEDNIDIYPGATGAWDEQGLRPEGVQEPTEHGVIAEFGTGLLRGGLNVIQAVPEMADFFGEALGWQGLESAGEAASSFLGGVKDTKWMRKSHSLAGSVIGNWDKLYDPNFYAALMGEGIPTIAAMILPGTLAMKGVKVASLGGRALTGAKKLEAVRKMAGKVRFGAGYTGAATLEASGAMQSVKAYEKNTGKEISMGKKALAVLGTGVVAGGLEYVPIVKVLGKKGATSLVRKVVQGFNAAGWEGGTEGAQELIANTLARVNYNADQEMLEGVVESIIGGILLGGGMSQLTSANATWKGRLDNTDAAEIVGIQELGEREWYKSVPEKRIALIKKAEEARGELDDIQLAEQVSQELGAKAWKRYGKAEYLAGKQLSKTMATPYEHRLTEKQRKQFKEELPQEIVDTLEKLKTKQFIPDKEMEVYSRHFITHPKHRQLKYERPSSYRITEELEKRKWLPKEFGSRQREDWGKVPKGALVQETSKHIEWFDKAFTEMTQIEMAQKKAGLTPPIDEVAASSKALAVWKRKYATKPKRTDPEAYAEHKGFTKLESIDPSHMAELWRNEVINPQFISEAKQVKQGDVTGLFKEISNNNKLTPIEKDIAMKGLSKLFGGQGKSILTEQERSKLTAVFTDEFLTYAQANQYNYQAIKGSVYDIINIPKAVMAAADLSAPLRQGIMFTASRPKRSLGAFGAMLKEAVSFEGGKLRRDIAEGMGIVPGSKTAKLYKQHGLDITAATAVTGEGIVTAREEDFMSSYAEKIPYYGSVVKWSNRTYTTFLNKLRTSVFDDFVKMRDTLKIEDPNFLTSAAKYINTATGRGELPGGIEKYAAGLNATFFSPKLIMSRLQMCNPVFYTRLHPEVRRQALKDVAITASTMLSVMGLAILSGAAVRDDEDKGLIKVKSIGAMIEPDPRSSDFGKVRFDNKRFDIFGGFGPLLRAMAQLISGQYKNAQGDIVDMGALAQVSNWFSVEPGKPKPAFGGKTVGKTVTSYFRNKLSPVAGFVTDWYANSDFKGTPFDTEEKLESNFIPMAIQDMLDLWKEEGKTAGSLWAIPAVFGVGVQVYGGVNSYGLSANKPEYKTLNKELVRLRVTMGKSPAAAYGTDLTSKEIRDFRSIVGPKVATQQKRLINSKSWATLADNQQRKLLKKAHNKIRTYWIRKMFWTQERKQRFEKRKEKAVLTIERQQKQRDRNIGQHNSPQTSEPANTATMPGSNTGGLFN